MLYTEDTRIAALAVHIVGNKAKDEPLLVAPALSGQVGDTGLMQTLTAYFAGGFKSEEYYNLHHETDLPATKSTISSVRCSTTGRRSTTTPWALPGTFTRRAHTRRSRAANFTSSISPAAVSGARRSMPSGFSSPRPAIRSSRSGSRTAAAYLLLPGNQRRQTGQRVPRVQYRA